MRTEILYKYRSLNNFEYFVDILVNHRLYAASYKELNDIEEGKYVHTPMALTNQQRNIILSEKEKIRICSLSTQKNDPQMWAYYADGHKGVNLGVIVTGKSLDILPVNYGPEIEITGYTGRGTIQEILTHKNTAWQHENEKRVLTYNAGSSYVTIQVKEIILGARISKFHQGLIKKLAEKFTPDAEIIKFKDL